MGSTQTTSVGITRLQRIPLVTTSAYADGDVIGGLLTFTDFAERDTGVITRVGVQALTNFGTLVVHMFNSLPAASTFTDNGVMAINAADKAKRFRSILIAPIDVLDAGIGGFEACKYVTEPFNFLPGAAVRNLYVVVEAAIAVTLAPTAELAVWIGGELN